MALFERWVGFNFSLQLGFHLSTMIFKRSIDAFVQGCQSYFSHFEIVYYPFCSRSIQVEEKLCLKLFKLNQKNEQKWFSISHIVIGRLYTKTKLVILLQPLSLAITKYLDENIF